MRRSGLGTDRRPRPHGRRRDDLGSPDRLTALGAEYVDRGEVASDLVDESSVPVSSVSFIDASVLDNAQDRLKPRPLTSNAAPHARPASVVTGISQSQSSPA